MTLKGEVLHNKKCKIEFKKWQVAKKRKAKNWENAKYANHCLDLKLFELYNLCPLVCCICVHIEVNHEQNENELCIYR